MTNSNTLKHRLLKSVRTVYESDWIQSFDQEIRRDSYKVGVRCDAAFGAVASRTHSPLRASQYRVELPLGVDLHDIADHGEAARRLTQSTINESLKTAPFVTPSELHQVARAYLRLLIWYASRVDTGREFDPKSKDPRYEPAGNFLAGYLAEAAGISDWVARSGAGIHQLLGPNESFGVPFLVEPLGDPPEDRFHLQLGAERYRDINQYRQLYIHHHAPGLPSYEQYLSTKDDQRP